ncbi:MAG TPA: hypothetical protein VF653_12445, partial [Methylomirabilota bacterium]
MREKYGIAAPAATLEPGGVEDLRAKYDTASRVPLEPGEHWSNPLDEQHPDVNRFRLKTWADAGPRTMQANLERAGFEAHNLEGMRFSVRKPGEKAWRVLDPQRVFATAAEPLKDIWDVGPSLGFLGYGYLKGGALGAGAGSVAGPLGTVIGGAAGAAGGSGVAEAAKQGVAESLGYHVDPEESKSKVAYEAAAGGIGRLL